LIGAARNARPDTAARAVTATTDASLRERFMADLLEADGREPDFSEV
jgi:hypothetical protein